MIGLSICNNCRRILSVLRTKMSSPGRGLCRLVVEPREGLVDEAVRIQITGLKAEQHFTIHARLVEDGIRMSSWGHYVASVDGSVDLSRDPSQSGTYQGVESMGLFWSMILEAGQRRGARLAKKDVTSPYDITLSVVDDHIGMDTMTSLPTDCLCQENVHRWYKHPDVKRKEIMTGNIRATMFVPPGPGPHPGVIDMFGSSGGIMEHKAALLASHGFTTLALPWFNYKDLPKEFEDVDFGYFLETVDWFSAQPEVSPSSIGTMGVSKGSDFALLLGMKRPNVKAVVSIGGTPFIMFSDLKFGKTFLPGVRLDMSKGEKTERGSRARESLPFEEYHLFDYSQMNGKVLFIAGDDDGTLLPGVHEPSLRKLSPDKRKDFRYMLYPKTGHLIEPPFAPICSVTYHKSLKTFVDWGGTIPDHAKAQEHSWKTILEFFRENLVTQPHNSDFKAKL